MWLSYVIARSPPRNLGDDEEIPIVIPAKAGIQDWIPDYNIRG